MGKVRVLVVDDSVVVRRIVARMIEEHADLELAGVAANGRIALAKIPQVNPDVVTLDVEMPDMDGLTALQELRKTYSRLPVIMLSTLTQRGAAETLDALSFGASDYVTKPSGDSLDTTVRRLHDDLVPKLLAFGNPSMASGLVAPRGLWKPSPAPPTLAPQRALHRIDVVVIGVSTGGPNALATLVPALPADLPVPVLVVQHMPPVFTRILADRLDTNAALAVREAVDGATVDPGAVWIAAGDHHLLPVRSGAAVHLVTNQDPPENSCRPAADVLFRAAAGVFGPGVLAVVLTGMGQDGLRGAEVVRDAGGQVIAQDEESSVVWGMPGFVVQAGLADAVLPLDHVAPEIVRRVRRNREHGSARAPLPTASHA